MRAERAGDFPIQGDLAMFNHASYGLATHDMMRAAEAVRRELETDPNVRLGPVLQERLASALDDVCAFVGLPPSETAVVTNATTAAAAVMASLPLGRGDVVLVLDTEYSSVQRGWARRCEETGARLVTVPLRLPVHDQDDLFAQLAQVDAPSLAVAQISAVTSSAALQFPVRALAAWVHARGGLLVVDAAHGPGHLAAHDWNGHDGSDIAEDRGCPDIVFATLHKWLPVPRSAGLLWARADLAALIQPAEVSLSYDEPTLAARFAWPGTFDPAPRLVLPQAIHAWRRWRDVGDLTAAERIADVATDQLAALGAAPTAGTALRPPRLRAFLLPGVGYEELRDRLIAAGIRAWTGRTSDGTSLLRIATHVYTDELDVERLLDVIRKLTAGRPQVTRAR